MKRSGVRQHSFPYLFFICIILCVCNPAICQASGDVGTRKSCTWSFLAGYGSSHPGWGKTRVRVETIDMTPRLGLPLINDIGSSWYRGYHSLVLELPVHFIVHPDASFMVGANFLACYTFAAHDEARPYLFAGGGPLYVDADIPGMGADWNGNYQFGIGLQYKISTDHDILLEYRFHHVSNGGRKDPNDPLNSSKFLLGLTF